MIRLLTFGLCLFTLSTCSELLRAEDEYRVEVLNEAAPADAGLSPEIAAAVSSTGFKVMKGESRTVCSFWPAKQWAVQADFKPTPALLYPLSMGQFVGVINYKRDGEDFRGQEIEKGTYTVRFALQPVDGNHVGTSDTRDFLVLVKPADDAKPDVMPPADLMKKSAAAAGTPHPAMLSLLAASAAAGEAPTLEHNAERELWSVGFANPTTAGKLTMQIVVVGKAAE